MKKVVILATLLSSACGPTAKQDMLSCQMDSRRAYPAEDPFESFKVHEFTHICMQRRGYEDVDYGDKRCSGSFEDLRCYKPK
jgi:hypothetical protein